jgi:hypothetical protein
MATGNGSGTKQRTGNDLAGRVKAAGKKTGKAYVFLRRWGASGNGHAGWGCLVDDTHYDCGSMENNSGHPTRNDDETNDAWFRFDVSAAEMVGLFRGGVGPVDRNTTSYGGDSYLPKGKYLNRPEPYQTDPIQVTGRRARDPWFNPLAPVTVHTDPVIFLRYTEYAFIEVTNPNVDAARKIAQASPNRGYGVSGNNCANLAYEIVSAYGVPDDKLSWLQTHPQPSVWFDDLIKKGWTRVGFPALPG